MIVHPSKSKLLLSVIKTFCLTFAAFNFHSGNKMLRISLHHLLLLMEPDRSEQKMRTLSSCRSGGILFTVGGTEKNIRRDEKKIEPK